MEHTLKCWPNYFQAVKRGDKKVEIRLNDRDYKCGDILHLQEWDPEDQTFTGDECTVEVTHIVDEAPFVTKVIYCYVDQGN